MASTCHEWQWSFIVYIESPYVVVSFFTTRQGKVKSWSQSTIESGFQALGRVLPFPCWLICFQKCRAHTPSGEKNLIDFLKEIEEKISS